MELARMSIAQIQTPTTTIGLCLDSLLALMELKGLVLSSDCQMRLQRCPLGLIQAQMPAEQAPTTMSDPCFWLGLKLAPTADLMLVKCSAPALGPQIGWMSCHGQCSIRLAPALMLTE